MNGTTNDAATGADALIDRMSRAQRGFAKLAKQEQDVTQARYLQGKAEATSEWLHAVSQLAHHGDARPRTVTAQAHPWAVSP